MRPLHLLPVYCTTRAIVIIVLSICGSFVSGTGAAFILPNQKETINHGCIVRSSQMSTDIDNDRNNYSGIRSIPQIISRKVRGLFWPGSFDVDPAFPQPLPPAVSFGCPFIGNNILAGSHKEGPESFYSKASAKLGHPRIWRFFFFVPCASVSGKDATLVLQQEYSKYDILTMDSFSINLSGKKKNKQKRKRKRRPVLYGTNSVMFEHKKEKHERLRRMVGAALTSAAVEQGYPNIIKAANDQIDTIFFNGGSCRVQTLAENLTFDVAWRQILGLKLEEGGSEKEIAKFRKAVYQYVSGLFSTMVMLPIPFKSVLLSPYRARKYLVSKINSRIDQLEESGPDGSTLSDMVFAVDDGPSSHEKLSRDEVIENSLVLLVAGTETTASTVTTALFLLGLHPNMWDTLVKEQQHVCDIHGSEMTKELLDDHCPYLDAVVQETLRIAPLSGVFTRVAKETMIIDGKQVPKGHAIFPNIRLTHELDPLTNDGTIAGSKENMDPRIGFKPERWLNPETRPSEHFIPFGSGPRRCLDYNLAMAEIKIFLSLMARRVPSFELTGTGSKKDGSIRWQTRSLIPKPVMVCL